MIQFYPDEDMLYLGLADAPSTEGEEIADGVVFHYDAAGRIVSIEIDQASRRVDLSEIRRRNEPVADEDDAGHRVFTAAELAQELGVTSFAVQKIRKAMREAGVDVGIRPDLPDSLLSERDLANIRQWRLDHPRGRPRRPARA